MTSMLAPATAQHTAGLSLRSLVTLEQVTCAEALLREVWGSPGAAPLTAEVMRAVGHSGGYLVGAYDAGGMVGVSAGFLGLGSDGATRLHSHISGVRPSAQGRGVGLALKLHQGRWALERGIESITWTFDPLVRRNAHFNLTRLGAYGVEYLIDFYGPMQDGLNAGDPSDRLYTCWDLVGPRARSDLGGVPAPVVDGAVLVLDAVDDAPVVLGAARSGSPALVRLPPDVESLRVEAPALATRWRLAVRAALVPLLAGGRQVTGVTDGCLLVSS